MSKASPIKSSPVILKPKSTPPKTSVKYSPVRISETQSYKPSVSSTPKSPFKKATNSRKNTKDMHENSFGNGNESHEILTLRIF